MTLNSLFLCKSHLQHMEYLVKLIYAYNPGYKYQIRACMFWALLNYMESFSPQKNYMESLLSYSTLF
jgi:hypothetical protein